MAVQLSTGHSAPPCLHSELSHDLPTHLWACDGATHDLVPHLFIPGNWSHFLFSFLKPSSFAVGCVSPSVSGFIFEESGMGPPGWLSRLSIRSQLRSGLRVMSSSPALGSMLGAKPTLKKKTKKTTNQQIWDRADTGPPLLGSQTILRIKT